MHGNLKPVGRFTFERWNRAGRTTVILSAGLLAVMFVAPLFLPPSAVDKLTTLWVYVTLAVVWNLLAGFAGLVSVGQQGYFGAGAYLTLRFVEAGMNPWIALIAGAAGAGLIAIPLSFYVLKLRDGEFAIATWVLAEVLRIVVMFDPLVQGDTGNSLIALNVYDPEFRRNMTYWLGLSAMAGFLVLTFRLLRSRTGGAAQAIRDDEEAARSVGIDIFRTKQIIYVAAAFGSALAGVVWLASAITFLPRTNFGVLWTVFMLFMVLVGGLKTFEGPILGAVVFFLLQELFGDYGAWYLFGLGAVAIAFALALPDGLWGLVRRKINGDLLPTGTVLRERVDEGARSRSV
jgi:branched-chain amino acid transport system permease protein